MLREGKKEKYSKVFLTFLSQSKIAQSDFASMFIPQ